jgi:Centromere protein H (CENP-H)
LSALSSKVQSARKDLENVEHENAVVARENVELSTKMLTLAQEASSQRKEDIDDPKARQQLDELEADIRISRQRYRIMKGTASATIAGSGIDWARDPKLSEIVLDDDGDDG